jgi:hypothetical protein
MNCKINRHFNLFNQQLIKFLHLIYFYLNWKYSIGNRCHAAQGINYFMIIPHLLYTSPIQQLIYLY